MRFETNILTRGAKRCKHKMIGGVDSVTIMLVRWFRLWHELKTIVSSAQQITQFCDCELYAICSKQYAAAAAAVYVAYWQLRAFSVHFITFTFGKQKSIGTKCRIGSWYIVSYWLYLYYCLFHKFICNRPPLCWC